MVRDTLGAAVEIAGRLPAGADTAVLAAARDAFVAGMRVSAVIAAVVAVAAAVQAAATFRRREPTTAAPVDETLPSAVTEAVDERCIELDPSGAELPC